jgi:hypothetical protein
MGFIIDLVITLTQAGKESDSKCYYRLPEVTVATVSSITVDK